MPELCVTELYPEQVLALVPEGSELENVAPPLAFSKKPLNDEPDSVTVTVEPAAAELGAVMLVEAEPDEPWPGMAQPPAPLE